MSASHGLILVADDDEDIVRFIEINLRLEGFQVTTASDGDEAIQVARHVIPDLVLLDVMMPKTDGFEVCRHLREDARTKHISVIMLTAKSLPVDKVVGLTSGADDYISKPFDPDELVARVKSALRRTREMGGVNPLSHLPSDVQVKDEVARRIEAGETFGLLSVDLDNLRALNDRYGFVRGDEAIKSLAACVAETVARHDRSHGLVGHGGGDDFVAVVRPAAVEAVAKAVVESWTGEADKLFDAEELERGYIEVADRRNQVHRLPLTAVSIGAVSNAERVVGSHWEAAEIASEMRRFAKREAGSSYAVDRRRAEGKGPTTSTRELPGG